MTQIEPSKGDVEASGAAPASSGETGKTGETGETGETRETVERGAWGKQIEFFLTIVGWAVGLGNIWRFPYLCYLHGGGTFLIPYLIMLIIVGMPIFFFELSIGQFAGVGPFHVWNMSPIFRGLGFAGVSITWMVSLYYNVLIAWSWRFLFASFTSTLPWTTCTNDWNTPACLEGPDLKNLTDMNATADWLKDRNMTLRTEIKTPSEEYFYNEVLRMSSGFEEMGTPVWELVLCLMFSWLLCFLVLIKGINSLGKSMYFVTIFPYVMMTILVIQSATLDGAREGVIAYLNPDLNALGKAQMWSDAATQIFYTLGTCSGGLISMASFNPFRHNILRDSLTIPVINGLTSLYSGFAIFSVLGFMAKMKGVPIPEVVADGPGLVFVVYPEALSQMPVAPLWSFLFFLMIITLGYSSVFSMVETVFISVIDLFPATLRKDKTRPIILRGVAISVYFLITLPMVYNGGFYLFDITNTMASGFPMLIVGFLQFAAVSWVYGHQRFAEDIAMMLGKKPNIYFRVCWVVISPIALLVITIALAVAYKAVPYPAGAQALGWIQVTFLLGWIPVMAIVYVLVHAKVWKSIAFLSKPNQAWGPYRPEDRTGRYYQQPDNEVSIDTKQYGISMENIQNDVKMVPSSASKADIVSRTSLSYDNDGYASEKF